MNSDIVGYIRENLAAGYTKEAVAAQLRTAGYDERDITQAFMEVSGEPSTAGTRLGIWRKIWLAIFSPYKLFEHTRHERIKEPLFVDLTVRAISLFLHVMLFGGTLILGVVSFAGEHLIGPYVYAQLQSASPPPASPPNEIGSLLGFLGVRFIVIFALIYYVGMVAANFLGAGILHLSAMAFQGKGRYSESYKSIIYAYIPANFFFIIPFVGFLAFIWSIILLVLAVHTYYSVSIKRAIAIVAVSAVIFIILVVIITFFLAVFFSVMGLLL